MPSYRPRYKKPWAAAVHVRADRKTYHLGYFATREEAEAAEQGFRKCKPGPGKAWPESARQKSKEVRKQKAEERRLAGIYVPPPAEPKKPLSAHERAIERAMRAM